MQSSTTRSIASREQKVLFSVVMFLTLVFLSAVMVHPAHARQFPECTNPSVEARIFKDFQWAEKKTWRRGLDLVSLTRVHEHRTVQHEGSFVTRRYCMAHAHLSDGKKRNLYFMINDRGGFAGQTWKVTHCIIGLDPWKNHDGNCRAIR